METRDLSPQDAAELCKVSELWCWGDPPMPIGYKPPHEEKRCEGPDCQSTKDDKQPDIDPLMNTHLPVVAEPDPERPGVSAHDDTEDEKYWIPGEVPRSPELDAECIMGFGDCECTEPICPGVTAAEISARDEIEQGGQEPANEDRNGRDFIPPSPPAVEVPSVWEAVCAETPGLCEDPPLSPLPSWPPIADSGVEISARDTEDVNGENIVPLPPNFLSCTFSDGTLTCPDEPFESLCGPSNVPCAEARPPPPVSWPPPECAMDLCPGDEYDQWKNDLFNELFDRDDEIEQRQQQQEGEDEEEPATPPAIPGSLPFEMPAPVDIESMMRWLCVAPTLAHEYKYYCCLAEPGSQPIMCADFAQLPQGAIVEERPDAASA